MTETACLVVDLRHKATCCRDSLKKARTHTVSVGVRVASQAEWFLVRHWSLARQTLADDLERKLFRGWNIAIL